ncbi:MAG: PQQ-binding-like beta-propeller repeat protein [Fimbriimonadaceae bacterium]|nr:PQQ-binding-like beta-propeller repeat protein [Fimbriimonadaceae bacterium]
MSRLSRRDVLRAGAAAAFAPRLPFRREDGFTFGFFSDTHVSDRANLEACVAMGREMVAGFDPAFCVNGGDVVEVGWATEYDRYKGVLEALAGRETHHIPGNHDVRWAPRGLMLFRERLGQPFRRFDHGGCRFMLLDSTVPLSHYGHYESAQLRWFETSLKDVGRETPVFVFTHHWIGLDRVMVDNESALIRLLEPYNVKIVFNGHGHNDLLWHTDGMLCTMNKGLYQGSFQKVEVDTGRGEVRLSRRSTENPMKLLATVPLKSDRAKRPVWALSNERIQEGSTLWLRTARQAEVRWDDGPWTPTLGRIPTTDRQPGEHRVSIREGGAGRMAMFDVTVEGGGLRPLWRRKLTGGVMSHLVLSGSRLCVSAMDGSVWCLDKASGDVVWKAKTGGYCHSSPALSGDTLVVGSSNGFVNAVAASDGAYKWSVHTGGPVYASAAIAKGIVAMASGDGRVYGLDVESGREMWRFILPPSPSAFSQSIAASDGERFFIGAWDKHLYALDVESGGVVWSAACTDKTFAYSPAIGSPTYGNGRVYVPSNDNGLWAFDARTGEVAWRATTSADKFGYSGPCLVDDRIVIGCLGDNGEARCVSAVDGKEIWTAKVGSVIYDSSPAVADGMAYVGSVDGLLHQIRMSDGEVTARYRMPQGHFLASPAAEKGRVYAGTYSDWVLGFATPEELLR